VKAARRPLNRAIYARLHGSLRALDSSIVEVGNSIPQESVMPYVQIGESTAVDISAHGEPGQEVTVTLHIWSSYDGDEEADSIIDQVQQALGIVPLAVPGFSVPQSNLDYSDVMIDPTGTARHGIVRWRAKLYEV
jgi:hypothetical protein